MNLQFPQLLCSMEETIGKHIQKFLRYKGISNKDAGESIGLSESAFEKLLTKDDILISRLLKLSQFAEKNFLLYYYGKEPLESFRKEEFKEVQQKLVYAETVIAKNDLIIEMQSKYIRELEEKLKGEKG